MMRFAGQRSFDFSLRRASVAAALCALAVFIAVVDAGATVIHGEYTFDANTEGWQSDDGWASVSWVNAGGNPGGWLSTTWTNLLDEDLGAPWWSDTFTNSADSLFAGDWETNMWFDLDFWASNNTPEAVQILWGATNSTRVWKNTVYDDAVDSMNLGDWTRLQSASFLDYTDWKSPPLEYNAANFLQDLASIDWIGIKIYRGDMAEDIYGIDNLRLLTPEPAEIIFLLFAGMTSWLSARKKRRGRGGKDEG